jgi:hypothetical protein
VAQRIIWALVIALFALTGFTAYRNVFADDSAVRATAEKLARATAGCGDCKVTRIEGRRGVFSESFGLTLQKGVGVAVSCRGPLIAFGDYACTATKD